MMVETFLWESIVRGRWPDFFLKTSFRKYDKKQEREVLEWIGDVINSPITDYHSLRDGVILCQYVSLPFLAITHL